MIGYHFIVRYNYIACLYLTTNVVQLATKFINYIYICLQNSKFKRTLLTDETMYFTYNNNVWYNTFSNVKHIHQHTSFELYMYQHINAAIFQTTFSSASSPNENMLISIKIPLKPILKGRINNMPAWGPSHYLNQWCLFYWRIYASLDPNELTKNITLRTIQIHTVHHMRGDKIMWSTQDCFHDEPIF